MARQKEVSAQELMEHAMADIAYALIRIKIKVQSIEDRFECVGVEGTFHGVDLYEVLRGIRDNATAALSCILSQEGAEYAVRRVRKESRYVIKVAGDE